ncbi:MAG: hypothetical protein EB127_31885, partial [Alphaproteobacteria bacterium]|nr:hypothetical protein [Alphaproteobacteria bacterium]
MTGDWEVSKTDIKGLVATIGPLELPVLKFTTKVCNPSVVKLLVKVFIKEVLPDPTVTIPLRDPSVKFEV